MGNLGYSPKHFSFFFCFFNECAPFQKVSIDSFEFSIGSKFNLNKICAVYEFYLYYKATCEIRNSAANELKCSKHVV